MKKLIGRVLQVSRSAKAPGPWFSAKVDLGQGQTIRVKGNDETLEKIGCMRSIKLPVAPP